MGVERAVAILTPSTGLRRQRVKRHLNRESEIFAIFYFLDLLATSIFMHNFMIFLLLYSFQNSNSRLLSRAALTHMVGMSKIDANLISFSTLAQSDF